MDYTKQTKINITKKYICILKLVEIQTVPCERNRHKITYNYIMENIKV